MRKRGTRSWKIKTIAFHQATTQPKGTNFSKLWYLTQIQGDIRNKINENIKMRKPYSATMIRFLLHFTPIKISNLCTATSFAELICRN